jgi:hypothetical protein
MQSRLIFETHHTNTGPPPFNKENWNGTNDVLWEFEKVSFFVKTLIVVCKNVNTRVHRTCNRYLNMCKYHFTSFHWIKVFPNAESIFPLFIETLRCIVIVVNCSYHSKVKRNSGVGSRILNNVMLALIACVRNREVT